jgi:DNA topoisomerase-1
LGKHPSDEGEVAIYSGRYGPYVQHGKIRATIAKSEDPETLTMDEALALIATKAAKETPAKAKKSTAKKTVTKKATAKKAPAKKPTKKVTKAK